MVEEEEVEVVEEPKKEIKVRCAEGVGRGAALLVGWGMALPPRRPEPHRAAAPRRRLPLQLGTPPIDPRYPNTNQARHCFVAVRGGPPPLCAGLCAAAAAAPRGERRVLPPP